MPQFSFTVCILGEFYGRSGSGDHKHTATFSKDLRIDVDTDDCVGTEL